MKKLFLILAALSTAMTLGFTSCAEQDPETKPDDEQKEPEVPEEPEEPLATYDVTLTLGEVGMHEFSVDVTVEPGDTYYINCYPAASAPSAESVLAELNEKVAAGASWGEFLYATSKTFTYDNLESGVAYKVMAFGVRGDGSLASEVSTLEVSTTIFNLTINVTDINPFNVVFDIDCTTDKIGWFGISLYYDPIYDDPATLKEVVCEYVDMYTTWGYGYEDLMFFGKETVESACSPGVPFVIAALGFNSDFTTVGDVVSLIVTPPTDGVTVLAENTSDGLYAGLYDYMHKSLGCIYEVDSSAPFGYIYNVMDFNNNGVEQFGVGLYDLSDAEIAQVMADFMTYEVDSYKEYFQGMSPDEVMFNLYYTTEEYVTEGALWSPIEVADLLDVTGQMPGKGLSAIGIFTADSNLKVSPIAVCSVRYDYSVIDYSAVLAAFTNNTGIKVELPRPSEVRVPYLRESEARPLIAR